jgi:hypothetical protein
MYPVESKTIMWVEANIIYVTQPLIETNRRVREYCIECKKFEVGTVSTGVSKYFTWS